MTELLSSCYSFSPREYWGLLETITLNRAQELQNIFSDFHLSSHACLAVVGSDGKRERHPQSKTEVVIWQSQPDHQPPDLPKWYEQSFDRPYSDSFDSGKKGCEVKTLSEPVPLSYAFGDEDLVYPDRVLNAHPILGNQDIYYAGRRRVLAEMTDDTETGKRIREHLKQQRATYKQALTSYVYRNQPVFSLDPPAQFYNGEGGVFGFKIPVLRLVQRCLDTVTVKAIRTGLLDIGTASVQLPTPTIERLDYFMKLGVLPEDGEVSLAYLWFLKQYHCAQELYQQAGRKVELEFDLETYNNHIRSLLSFMKKRG